MRSSISLIYSNFDLPLRPGEAAHPEEKYSPKGLNRKVKKIKPLQKQFTKSTERMKQKVTTRTVPTKMMIPWVPERRGKVPGTSTRLGAKGRPSRRPSMPGIKGRHEGHPLAPKRVAPKLLEVF